MKYLHLLLATACGTAWAVPTDLRGLNELAERQNPVNMRLQE
jgi:hypothetical protein